MLIILIIFFTLINKRELFQSLTDEPTVGICKYKKITTKYLNGERPEVKSLIYNNFEGASCLAKCIRNFGQNILYTNPEGSDDMLKWNKDNPTKGFCYRANDDKYPFLCEGSNTNDNKRNCRRICGKDLNSEHGPNRFLKYNPDIDFSNCRIDDKLGCVEKTLNMCSGNSYEKHIGCKECIQQYMPSINTLNKLRNKQLTEEIEEGCD